MIFLAEELYFANARSSSIVPLIRNLAKRLMILCKLSSDFVTTIERIRNAANRCLWFVL